MADINVMQSRAAPYAGVKVFFNPRWVAEIKIGARSVAIFRRNKHRSYRQRIIVIHTIKNAYHIPLRWWIEWWNPLSRAILFSEYVIWRYDSEKSEHIFECRKQRGLSGTIIVQEGSVNINKEGEKQFSVLDVERIERDGLVLWQKKR